MATFVKSILASVFIAIAEPCGDAASTVLELHNPEEQESSLSSVYTCWVCVGFALGAHGSHTSILL